MRILGILSIIWVFLPSAIGQDFFYIGEESFPCTKKFSLLANSDTSYNWVDNLEIMFGKYDNYAIIIVSTKTYPNVRINGKLIIYLDDGTVISCIDRGINDNVDDIASSVYRLTSEELNKMKDSNINTIRYEIRCAECIMNPAEGNYSASNEGDFKTDYPSVLNEFYSK